MPLGSFRLNGLAKYIVSAQTGITATMVGGDIINYGKIGPSFYNPNGGWIEVAQNAAFAFGTSTNFTVEGWFWFGGTVSNQYMFDGRPDSNSLAILFDGNFLKVYIAGAYRLSTAANALRPNAWHHVAYTRSGTTGTLWANGVSVGTWTDTTNYSHGNSLKIMSRFVSGQGTINSYCDEFRISNSARYTTTFTPTTTGFSSDANTLFLMHLDETPVYSANTITANANAQTSTAQNKFGGSSALFDGLDDRLTIANNNLLYWNTQPYTVEYWCRVTSFGTGVDDDPSIIGNMDPASAANYWSFGPDNSGNLTFKYWNGANNTVKDTGTMSLNTWYHCAAVISSNTIKIYLDGVEKASAAISGTPQFSTTYGGLNIGWGRSVSGISYNGYLDEVRISNSARYTSNFTPSTTAFTSDANTLLLMHMDGQNAATVFTDDVRPTLQGNRSRAPKSVTASGSAIQVSTQSKFSGRKSLFLNQPSRYGSLIVSNNASDLALGTGNFTVEFWYYARSYPAANKFWFDFGFVTGIRPVLFTGNSNTRQLQLLVGNGSGGSSTVCATGTTALGTGGAWQHIAVVRNSNVSKIYVDGVEQASGTDNNNYTFDKFLTIANDFGIASATGFNGYIDEFRVSNTARYTAAFTPSTTPFTNDNNTLLLLHMDGYSNIFLDDAGNTATDSTGSSYTTPGAGNTPPYPSTITEHTNVTSLASTITIPSTVLDGDLAMLFDTSTTTTDTTPSGFTQVTGTTTTGIRTNVSYKVLTTADASTTITGMAGTTRKILVIYRGNHQITQPFLETAAVAQSTTVAPTNQTLALSGKTPPLIGFAVYAKTLSTTPTRGWSVGSPTEYSSVSTSGIYVKALIFNAGTTPASTTISMTDAGTNTLQSFYLQLY